VEVDASNLVVVASPARFHAQQAIYALERGATVLCEKPMAFSTAEAEEMLRVCQARKGRLAIGLYRRFFPALESIKKLMETLPLGAMRRFDFREGGAFGWQAASESFFRKTTSGGGVFRDAGVHTIDLLLWWLGQPSAFAYEDDAMGGVEANCKVTMQFPNGCHGEFRLSRDWQTAHTYTFHFERGIVRWRVMQANRLEVLLDGAPYLLDARLNEVDQSSGRLVAEQEARSDPQSFIAQVSNVVGAMRGTEPLRIPGEEGIVSMRFIEACYARRRPMRMGWLSPEEQTAAAKLHGA
jgi:predicted dehydrogenase